MLYKTALTIAIVGCVNWGLVGIFNFNLVEFLFGNATILTRVVYVLVAISGLIFIWGTVSVNIVASDAVTSIRDIVLIK